MSLFLVPCPGFMSCTHVDSNTWYHHVSEKLHRRSWGSFTLCLSPLSQLERLPLPPLDKNPPETQSVTFLIRDEPWKQRVASKLCNRLHPLRGKSRVGLSCRREQAMTGPCGGGEGDHALWMVLSMPQLEELSGGDGIVPTYWLPVGNALYFTSKTSSLIQFTH